MVRPRSEKAPFGPYPHAVRYPERIAYREHSLLLAGAPLPLILGVTLPEPHAVAVTPDGGWWSWGLPFNPASWPELTVEEAWCLR